MSITFEQITKRYHGAPVVNDVSLQIKTGEFFVLLGPSGSGKSTLLRVAAGLTDVDHGRVAFHGQDVTHVAARHRGAGFVFQHYALFRHMTVGQNVEFALRVRGVRRSARARRRDELLQLVALEGYAGRMPGQLSGGQQQRVAVARALAHEPTVLLLDEPFGALDAKIRVELRDTIRQVQQRLGMSTVLVTHDQEEAFALGDRIGIMHNGRLLETGRPEQLYRFPTTRFVATFLGAANLILGKLSDTELHLGTAHISAPDSLRLGGGVHEAVTVIRPEDIEIARGAGRLGSASFAEGEVLSVHFAGSLERVRIRLTRDCPLQSAIEFSNEGAAAPLEIEVTRTNSEQQALPLVPGAKVAVGVRRFHLLPTPVSSFRIRDLAGQAAQRLRQAPILRQLTESMRARVIGESDETSGEQQQLGVTVLLRSADWLIDIGSAIRRGARRLLYISPQAPLARHVLIYCDSESSRRATLALLASVLRHLQAEATFISLHGPAAPRVEVAGAFRRLLDARAELLELHGLDIRTDVQQIGLGAWSRQLAASAEPILVVLGLTGTAAQIERELSGELAPLFGIQTQLSVMLSCCGPAPSGAELRAVDSNSPTAMSDAHH
jgi:sulfate/thiosulfate transport system ATP-binding protein